MENVNRLGFVGLGVMGGPMCRNLAQRSGKEVVAFDMSPTALEEAAEVGVIPASSVAEVAEQADIIFYSLPQIDHVESVTHEVLQASRRPQIIVDMSTSDVTRIRELGQKLNREGIQLVDAPVARLRQAAKDGTLLITVGAEPGLFQQVRPFLDCMGSDVINSGGLGTGQVIKIMNNMVVFQTMNALAEAVAIGEAAGVDPKHLLETLTLGSANSFALSKSALATLAVDSFPEKTFPTTYALKDLGLALALADDFAVPAESARATYKLLEDTRDAGFTHEYYPVMVRLLRTRAEEARRRQQDVTV